MVDGDIIIEKLNRSDGNPRPRIHGYSRHAPHMRAFWRIHCFFYMHAANVAGKTATGMYWPVPRISIL